MTLRADHVAGAAFVIFGVLIIALSGNLPTGQLSMPGSGFLPKIVATLMILFGLALVARAKENERFADISWSDGKHAAVVVAIASGSIALYSVLGFIITMILTILALLLIVERRNPIYAGIYSILVVTATYAVFEYILKTPLPESPFNY
ncbi:MAG TPA: tripartite tricarboxylate transporter TctB family protein [Pseudolabrys sp.]|nr:tripartite tricarboxylate transporter TctB family protein [Pseudolabrys sp.]